MGDQDSWANGLTGCVRLVATCEAGFHDFGSGHLPLQPDTSHLIEPEAVQLWEDLKWSLASCDLLFLLSFHFARFSVQLVQPELGRPFSVGLAAETVIFT